MTYDECRNTPEGHVIVDDDTYECDRCGADRCPVCGAWFPDYDAFLDHIDAEPPT